MATCPKCGYKLKLTDWRPDCPKCGINLVYYGMEESLLDDADAAEAEHAHFQKRIDRLKASFIGSPLTIIRIVLSLLPLGPLFLTLAKISYSGPFIEAKSVNVTALTLYNFVSSLDFDSLFAMFDSALLGKAFIFFAVSIVTILLSAVLILVSLICLIMACGPHGNVRNITLNSIMIALSVVSVISFSLFSSVVSKVFPDFYSGSLGIGAFVYIGALCLLLLINILIAVKGVNVKYKQCYIGGIKSEEYFELVANGTDKEEIRAKMSAALDERAREAEEEKLKKEAEKSA